MDAMMQQDGSYLLQKKLDYLFENQAKRYQKEFDEIKAELQKLREAVRETARTKLTAPPLVREETREVMTKAAVQENAAPRTSSTQEAPPAAESSGRARFGAYTPEDVSIEKFFNFSK